VDACKPLALGYAARHDSFGDPLDDSFDDDALAAVMAGAYPRPNFSST
jgi:hypothetical protein